jgi:hypothetical protein
MTTSEPNEEEMAAMINSLGLDAVTEPAISDLDHRQLLIRWNEVTQALAKRGELLDPKTQEGRDLHSQREALRLVLHEQGLR